MEVDQQNSNIAIENNIEISKNDFQIDNSIMPTGSCQNINSKLQFKDINTLKKYLVNQKGSQAARSQIIKLAAHGKTKRSNAQKNQIVKSFNN